MARSDFIENNVPGKVVLPSEVTNMPANSVVLVAYKNSFVAMRTTLASEFRWYCREALVPPDAKV